MSKDFAGWSVIVGIAVTLVLLGSGFAMWDEAPEPAEEAVGQGLLVLGVCSALITLTLLAYAISTAPRHESVARSDWDDA